MPGACVADAARGGHCSVSVSMHGHRLHMRVPPFDMVGSFWSDAGRQRRQQVRGWFGAWLAAVPGRGGRSRVVPVVGTWGGAGGVESARSRKEFKTLLAFGSDPNSLHDLLGMSVFLRKTRLCKQFGPRSCKEFAPDPKAGRVLNSLRDLAGFALRAALPPPSGQPRPDPPAGRPPPGCGSCFLGGM